MSVRSEGQYRNSTVGQTNTYNYTSSYLVLHSPKTGSSEFKVNFTGTYSNPSLSAIVWMHPNGTLIAVYENGVNESGVQGAGIAASLVSTFQIEYFYSLALTAYTSQPGVHAINQTTVTLGPTTLMVTNYGLSAPSAYCNGSGVISLNSVEIQTGTVAGTTLPLVTIWSEGSTFTPTGKSSSLISMSTASILSLTKS